MGLSYGAEQEEYSMMAFQDLEPQSVSSHCRIDIKGQVTEGTQRQRGRGPTFLASHESDLTWGQDRKWGMCSRQQPVIH